MGNNGQPQVTIFDAGGDEATVTNSRLDVNSKFTNQDKESFIVFSEAIIVGNNKSLVSLLNDTGSTVIIRLREIRLINTQNSNVSGGISDFGLYRFTGHSGGTLLTPAAFDTLDSVNGSVTARTGATITGEGSKLFHMEWSTDEWSTGTEDTESADHRAQAMGPYYANSMNDAQKPITLRAAEGVHIKHETNSTNGSFDVFFIFTQET